MHLQPSNDYYAQFDQAHSNLCNVSHGIKATSARAVTQLKLQGAKKLTGIVTRNTAYPPTKYDQTAASFNIQTQSVDTAHMLLQPSRHFSGIHGYIVIKDFNDRKSVPLYRYRDNEANSPQSTIDIGTNFIYAG